MWGLYQPINGGTIAFSLHGGMLIVRNPFKPKENHQQYKGDLCGFNGNNQEMRYRGGGDNGSSDNVL
ncbi:hypothetical protein COV93_05225 [Candidatus Woesearchaeota archaeon CG11_big_fil_rev_8_21_14_0_20_43_8]|nr:MAG: hypothetical protein COV93_05225 [Candidatus Woesearchaeota archaeon CG11_big_fil_rev_8_21_14_0_20_43_8]PIO05440.1 MAG: hypothetical protein COT47_04765 [Candidatus Woesearchaeota archaeon CG08_land_8_20_14_0_20_43_7]